MHDNVMADFHQHFRNQIRLLQEQVDLLSTPDTPVDERKTKADQALSSITKLSAELADASGELPSYDQRSYNQALRDLHDKLAVTQASHAPKAKFAFKNKRLAAPTSEGNSTTTSRSVTPSHLRDPENAVARGLAVPAMASPPTHLSSSRDTSQDRDERQPTAEPTARPEPPHISIESVSGTYLRCPRRGEGAEQTGLSQAGQSCVVSNVKSSVINLMPLPSETTPAPSSLTLNNISWSFILAPNISGPVHMTGLNDSTIALSCRQFRMHDSHNVDVYLYCSSRPIIEDCSNIRFTTMPSVFSADGRNENTSRNMYDQVDDFKWLRTEPSPNWRLMKDDEHIGRDTWKGVLETLEALDREVQEGLTPDPAGTLRVLGRSEAERVT